ncbi:uncharacterized protein LOC123472551 [Daphnia magna]|uniref:uncharacterized protein LOC123472551 n=1 Tax=Daphnia magna TaxID=35525 RepID=UPI001E1BB465|nr:uncharacterized protein LOC123472551 [Daphnia magna]
MPPKLSSGHQQPKNSKPSAVPFQINTRSTVYNRGAVVPSTGLTPFTTTSRRQVSRTPDSLPSSRIPVRVAPHRSQGGRLEYTLPSVLFWTDSDSDGSVTDNMANIQPLVDAVQDMTAAFAAQQQASATATAGIQNQLQQAVQVNNNLIAALQAQAVPVAGGGGVGGGGPVRIDNSLVESIPKFLGNAEELATEFIDRIEALAVTEGWTAQQQVLVAVRRLGGSAVEWHARVGRINLDWPAWSAAFRAAFPSTLPLSEWTTRMTARVQQPGEAIMQYAVAKEKLLLMSPVTLTDQQKVQAMTDGLSDWKNQASILQAAPANIAAFYTACAALPVSWSATTATPATGPLSPGFSVDDLAARIERMVIGRLGPVGRSGGGAAAVSPAGRGRGSDPDGRGRTSGGVGRGFVPVSDRQCFGCGKIGHIAKDCPAKK